MPADVCRAFVYCLFSIYLCPKVVQLVRMNANKIGDDDYIIIGNIFIVCLKSTTSNILFILVNNLKSNEC